MVESYSPDPPDFTIGEFTILTSRNLVICGESETSITPKMLLVLCELAEHQGKTLTKQQLFDAAWGSTVTTDMVLSRAIADLRKVFKDSAQNQQFIETVSKKGYRLKPSVKWLTSPQTSVENPSEEQWLTTSKATIAAMVGVLILAIIIFTSYDDSTVHSYAGAPQLVNLTTDHERERRVRFSPDGKSIVYSKTDSNSHVQQLVIHSLLNDRLSSIQSLTTNVKPNQLVAAFSPDGNKIAIREVSDEGCQITILSIATQIQEHQSQCPPSSIHSLDWSPKGIYLATTKLDLKKKRESIVLFNTQTNQFEDLSQPDFDSSGYLFPRYSPNGKKIAVIFLRPSSNMWVIGLISVKSGEFKQLFQSEQKINQIVWGDSNNELIYVLDSGIRSGIWNLEIDSGKHSHLLNGDMIDLDYSPISKQFAFTQQKRETSIWKISNNHPQKQLIEETRIIDSTYQNSEPRLSPDDQKLAYISTRSGIDSIWMKNFADNQTKTLFKSKNAKISDLAWSPNNKNIAFTLTDNHRSRTIFIDVVTRETREFKRPSDTSKAKWSPKGHFFYWVEKAKNDWLLMRKGENETIETVLNKPIKHYVPLSAEHIFYQEILSRKVQAYNIGTKVTTERLTNPYSHFYNWDARNRYFYFTAWSPEKKRTYLYRSEQPLYEAVELFPIDIASSIFKDNLSVSDDGTTAYFSKLTKLNYDVILMTH